MGEYENQYRALEREGDTACKEIKCAEEEIKNSENEIKECQNRITNLQKRRQDIEIQHSQQSFEEVGNRKSHTHLQLEQINKEINETGNKITFLTGKVSSLKTKLSENQIKLNDIINKLSQLKSKVSKEKDDFNSSYRGIKSESTQIKSKDSSDARVYLESSASKAQSMYYKRITNEKEIESIINKLKGCVQKSVGNIGYSGVYQVNFTGNKQPEFNRIPMLTYNKNKDEINKAIMNVKGSSIDNLLSSKTDNFGINKLIEELNSPEFIERSLRLYGNQLKDNKKGKNWAEEYYFYKKYKNTTTFNPYYEPYTKSILSNHYRKYDYK